MFIPTCQQIMLFKRLQKLVLSNLPLFKLKDGPIVLVLAPTRELAVQIQNECTKFGASSKIKNTCIYGGVPKGPQVRDLQKGRLLIEF